jgi:hypothetical protein
LKESALNVFGTYGATDTFATYASIPQYISSDIRCLFMENSEYMSFDLTQPDRVTVRLECDVMKGKKKMGKYSEFEKLQYFSNTLSCRSYFGWKDYA